MILFLKITKVLTILLLLVFFLPSFDYYVTETVIFLALPLLLIVINPRIFSWKAMQSFLVFLIFVIIDLIFNKDPFLQSKIAAMTYISMFIWLNLSYYFYLRRFEYHKIIKISLLSILTTVIISIFWAYVVPDIVRTNFQSDIINPGSGLEILNYSKLGLMSYGFGHAIPLLFPILIYIAKRETGSKKFLPYIFVVFSLFLLFKATITTAFFIGIIITILAYYTNTRKKTYFYVSIIILFFILIIVGSNVTIWALEKLDPLAQGTMMESKIQDILYSLQHNDFESGQIGVRSDLYTMSWLDFFSHPLFGSHTYKSMGGHAYFVDHLAYFGILGFLPFLLSIYFHTRYFIERIHWELKFYYILSIFYFISISFLKGFPAREMFAILFFVLPGLTLWTSYRYFPKSLK